MPTSENNLAELEKRLWNVADELRANSGLKASDYSTPVLGLIFLRYADHKFSIAEKQLGCKATGRRTIGKADYQAQGVMYLPKIARFEYLLKLPEKSDLGKEINAAMKAIEDENPSLNDVLPRNYNQLDKKVLIELLKLMASIPMEHDGDTLGRIYEYFLAEFAMTEGQKGGEFYTPTSIVKLIVEIIEPFHGLILDPACGSGGMFVQSARFVEERKKKPSAEISIYGQEKTKETVRLCKMNLAVHGLEGDIREANTYKEDVHKSVGKFNYVMANPPFNVNRVDMESLRGDPRFPFGLPTVDNANYLWIQIFYSALNNKGRSGFVMANSAADARSSELEIRKQLIKSGHVDVIVSVGSNFFYTVTLPVTLWFFDKGKSKELKDKVLFVDARNIYNQISRALRDFKPEQIKMIAAIVKQYRQGKLKDQPGLCKVATLKDIEEQGWSLNPGRYVGVAEWPAEEEDFKVKLISLNEELIRLNDESHQLEKKIEGNIGLILGK